MSRPPRVALISVAIVAVSALAAACGTERINVPKGTAANPTEQAIYRGAVLFSQRCAGCHTLSYAGTHGSASNIRTSQANNGPDFDTRCERPVTRVLYAIENGGFSGAIMPQNVVVGRQAMEVAEFVATYAGHKAETSDTPGAIPCQQRPLGTIPPSPTATPPTATTAASTTTSTALAAAPAPKKSKAKSKSAKSHKKS